MKQDDIQVGKIYYNGKGRRRRVNRIEFKRYRHVVWYTSINEKGKEGKEQYCAKYTFASWARGEWDPSMPIVVTSAEIPIGEFKEGDIVDHKKSKHLKNGEVMRLSKSGRTAYVKWPRWSTYSTGFKIENLAKSTAVKSSEGN